ncbi:hypothetical protein [Luteolibacter luteus]|uniref:Uncharacterized protein n=1 Tax=Luteolibacter luteus TaxID=2728835 RepID=A0A858RFU4_9BACT|nr:hypothetical protein [Luteolibacter luteus]QJE95986.1 hypothetical protein HHL09_09390 [Luteolibacter luteus]
MRASLERLAEAGGYTEGLVELGLETWINPEIIIDSVARTLIRNTDSNKQQIKRLASVAVEERIRHSKDAAERWIAENIFKMEVGK